jgi:hypothetical protein
MSKSFMGNAGFASPHPHCGYVQAGRVLPSGRIRGKPSSPACVRAGLSDERGSGVSGGWLLLAS